MAVNREADERRVRRRQRVTVASHPHDRTVIHRAPDGPPREPRRSAVQSATPPSRVSTCRDRSPVTLPPTAERRTEISTAGVAGGEAGHEPGTVHTGVGSLRAMAEEARTESDLPIRQTYGPDDLAGFDPETQLGEPGEFPFTRGVYPSMYTGRPWTMRQYAGFGTAKESNERYHQLVDAGTGGLSVAFDLPTQMGHDSDEPIAHGEVGKVGVAIDSIDDMRLLFDGLPLDEVSTSMTINAPGSVLLLLYQLVAEEQRDPRRQAHRDDPERRAQGVHRARHLHLPAEAVAAADHRYLRLLPEGDPALEHDLHLRLPHGRGRCDARAGDRLHPGERDRVRPRRAGGRPRRRRLRPAAVLLLRGAHDAAGGGREVPRGPADLGAGDARRLRREEPQVADAALPHADRRRAADRAAARGQPRPGRAPGSRRGARRNPVPAHQLVRRGDRAAHARRRPASRCGPSRSSPTRPTSRRPSTRSPVRTPSRR